MILTDDPNFARENFHLTPVQRTYAFVRVNVHYQELRPKFAKESVTVAEIIRLLAEDPICPIPGLCDRTIRRLLAQTRGRQTHGQWHFERTIDPVTGRETGCMREGPRIHYPHPAEWSKNR